MVTDNSLLFTDREGAEPMTLAVREVRRLAVEGTRRPRLTIDVAGRELVVEGPPADIDAMRALVHDLSWRARTEGEEAPGAG